MSSEDAGVHIARATTWAAYMPTTDAAFVVVSAAYYLGLTTSYY